MSGARSGSNERRLLNDLLEYYNQLERPVFNDSDAINLTFGLTLQQIIDVVSKREENKYLDISNISDIALNAEFKGTIINIIREGYKVSFSIRFIKVV